MYRHFLSLLFLALLSVACTDELTNLETEIAGADEIVIPFSIDDSSFSRSDEQPFDETIDHVYLLFYSDDNAKPDAEIRVSVQDADKLSFRLPSELKADVDYKLVAIANADDYVAEGYDDFSSYLRSASKLSDIRLFHSCSIVSSSVSVNSSESTSSQVCGVPMQATDDTFSFTEDNGTLSVNKADKLLFYRLVARVDFTNSAENLVVEKIAVCNWQDTGYLDASNNGSHGNIRGKISSLESEFSEPLQFIDISADNQSLLGALYCFPSFVENSTKGDENTTALIIKAHKQGESVSSFYRVNIGVKDGSSVLKANTRYTVNITDVKSTGFPSAEEAYIATTEPSTEPTIPEGMDFAIIPLNTDRVKVDHNARTIEIDAFDPDCFNSFIDIPFRVFINEDVYKSVTVTNDNKTEPNRNTLEWPLIGRFSVEESKDFYYCPNSFNSDANKASVYSLSEGKEVIKPFFSPDIKAVNNTEFYISVGAMAPDDPELIKVVRFRVDVAENHVFNNQTSKYINYTLSIKPREVIIDDVVLKDNDDYWLIMDRNVQQTSGIQGTELIGRDGNGKKRQAYNHVTCNPNLAIPNKINTDGKSFLENKHTLYLGYKVTYSSIGSLNNQINTMINKYLYVSDFPQESKSSPFYDVSSGWILSNDSALDLCCSKMKASKLRMYLVSDVPVKDDNGSLIPVCCYWPYYCFGRSIGDTSTSTYGYFYSNAVGKSLMLIYCDKTEIKQYIPSSLNSYSGLSRLVRPLTNDDVEDYKINYLGYGSAPCNLTPCHPDTYTSEGWSQY